MSKLSRRIPLPARWLTGLLAAMLLAVCAASPAAEAVAVPARTPVIAPARPLAQTQPAAGNAGSGGSLEAAASKAGELGRKVAMSLIATGLALASVVLIFRRRFKDAAGVFAVGFAAVLLASPAGVNVLRDTVKLLFGA